MRLFALIGYPLSHSFSQKYFTGKFDREGIKDAAYTIFPIPEVESLKRILQDNPHLCGLNVTIPHKEHVIPYLDSLDETAAAVGAVNCIRIQNGLLTGYNTDVYGFETSMLRKLNGIVPPGMRGIILGTGGAAKAAAYVFRKLGMPFQFVSRSPNIQGEIISYSDLRSVFEPPLCIVNTTPLGMAPSVETCPDIPFDLLGPQHFVFDLIYNPAETLLLQRAADKGAATLNGLEMLHLQAERSWEIWNQPPHPQTAARIA